MNLPQVKMWHFYRQECSSFAERGKKAFLLKKWQQKLSAWEKYLSLLLKKKEEKENEVELFQSCVLYSPPSDLLLWLTTVLKGIEWHSTMHWIYEFTSEKRFHFLYRTGNFAIKVPSFLALMLLYSQWSSWISYGNSHSFKTSTKMDGRYNHKRIYQKMWFHN